MAWGVGQMLLMVRMNKSSDPLQQISRSRFHCPLSWQNIPKRAETRHPRRWISILSACIAGPWIVSETASHAAPPGRGDIMEVPCKKHVGFVMDWSYYVVLVLVIYWSYMVSSGLRVIRVFLFLFLEWTPRAKRGTTTSKTETLLVWSCLHRHHVTW